MHGASCGAEVFFLFPPRDDSARRKFIKFVPGVRRIYY